MKKLFTLIELVVVIVVLGILSMIVIPNINGLKEESNQVAIDNNRFNLQTAVDMYMFENNGEIPTYSESEVGNPQVLDFDKLNPEYIRDNPKTNGVNYWIDYTGKVFVSPLDAPTGVEFREESNELHWKEVDGAIEYKIFKINQGLTSSSKHGGTKLEYIKSVQSSPATIESKGWYAVSSVDKHGNESPPVAHGYRGVTEKKEGYMSFNSNLAEEYREFLLINPKQESLEDITAEGWIYWRGEENLEGNGKHMGIFGIAGPEREGNSHFEIRQLDDGGILRVRLDEIDIRVPNAIKSHEWSHVAFTYDSKELGEDGEKGVLRLYVNGEIVGTISGETTVPLVNKNVTIGDSQFRPEEFAQKRPFNGRIRDFRLWERALSESEVKEIANNYHKEFTGQEEGLFGYWQLYKPMGDVVLDMTKNRNHAKIIGSPYVHIE